MLVTQILAKLLPFFQTRELWPTLSLTLQTDWPQHKILSIYYYLILITPPFHSISPEFILSSLIHTSL